MERFVGTVARGIRCPIIRQGDDLAEIISSSVLQAAQADGFLTHDRDVIGITESIVARAQGNYATIDDIAADVRQMALEGTTPRRLTDLIGSSCDLTSGSGDKGTPVVLVQGYFDNYTN